MEPEGFKRSECVLGSSACAQLADGVTRGWDSTSTLGAEADRPTSARSGGGPGGGGAAAGFVRLRASGGGGGEDVSTSALDGRRRTGLRPRDPLEDQEVEELRLALRGFELQEEADART